MRSHFNQILSLIFGVGLLLAESSLAQKTTPADKLKISGFLQRNKDARYFLVDSGTTLYQLKRKEVFLKNQVELTQSATRPQPAWVTFEVEKSDIVKQYPSKTKKAAAQAI